MSQKIYKNRAERIRACRLRKRNRATADNAPMQFLAYAYEEKGLNPSVQLSLPWICLSDVATSLEFGAQFFGNNPYIELRESPHGPMLRFTTAPRSINMIGDSADIFPLAVSTIKRTKKAGA